ncbi:MAG: hypothetical protein R3B06_29090 [Kofleriaceae bacterium]
MHDHLRRLAGLLAGLATVAALGCGRRRAAPAPADAAEAPVVLRQTAPAPTAPPTPPPAMPREVRAALLEAGAAPRSVRRYQHTSTAERTMVVTVRATTRSFHDGAWHGPTELPPFRDGFGVAVGPGGDADHPTLLLRGLPAAVDGGDGAARAEAEAGLARWRALLERRRLTVTIAATGRLERTSFVDDPQGTRPDALAAADELAQRWLAFAVPLPSEPIGVGARWQVDSILRQGGTYLSQTARYRLTAVDGERLTVEVELDRLGEPQPIGLAGVDARLLGLVRAVRGTVTLTTATPLPIAGALTVTHSSHARFQLAGGPVDELTDDHATLTIGE